VCLLSKYIKIIQRKQVRTCRVWITKDDRFAGLTMQTHDDLMLNLRICIRKIYSCMKPFLPGYTSSLDVTWICIRSVKRSQSLCV